MTDERSDNVSSVTQITSESEGNPQSMLLVEAGVGRPPTPAPSKGVPRPKSSRSSKSRPTAKAYAVAQNLLMGQSGQAAVLNAGYARSYARRSGAAIARSEAVRQALLEIKRNIRPGELGDLSEAALQQELLNMPKGAKNAKARLGFIRTGLEVDARIGGPAELHLHQHNQLPKVVEDMLLAKMEELRRMKEGAVDGELVEST